MQANVGITRLTTPLVVMALLVPLLASCGGEGAEDGTEEAPFAKLALEELLTLAEDVPAERATQKLQELERRLPELEDEALFGTVLPALEQKLADKRKAVRLQAVRVAAEAARLTGLEPAAALVARAVGDEEHAVRLQAVEELGGLLKRQIAAVEPVLHALAQACGDASREVRLQAFDALAAAGAQGRGAAAAVLARAEDDEAAHEERIAAWETLRTLEPRGEEVRKAIESAAATAEEAYALRATETLAALAKLEGEDLDIALEAVDALLAPLAHASSRVRLRAIEAIEDAGGLAADIADEPLAYVAEQDSESTVRRRAEQAREALGLSAVAE